MNDLGITPADRKVAVVARQKAEKTSGPALALELPSGEIVTGKNSELFWSYSRCLDQRYQEIS